VSTYCLVAACKAALGSALSVTIPPDVILLKVTLSDVPTACPIEIAPSEYVTPVPPDR